MTREFKVSKSRCFEIIRIMVLCVLCSGILTIHYADKDPLRTAFLAVILLYSLYLCIKYIQIRNCNNPLLIITSQGIVDNYYGFGFIYYSEIQNIELINHKKQNTIKIKIKNINNILQRLNKPQRFLRKLKRQYNKYCIQVPTYLFQEDTKEIFTVLNNAFNEHQQQNN